MKPSFLIPLATAACLAVPLLLADKPAASGGETGWESLFDGKSLDGWDGNPDFWSVQDGVITGETTAGNPTKGNTFLIWRGGEPADFELELEYRIFSGNSGVQYRSFEPGPKWVIGGYQSDLEAGDRWSGANYGERFRGILAKRGEKTVIGEDGKPTVTGSVGDSAAIQAKIRKEDWNRMRIVAKGHHLTQSINGMVTSEVTDEDTSHRRDRGLIALQLHAGPPMKVQFRNIRLKRSVPEGRKKVVFLAGKRSHGYGAHEHRAGCMLLAKQLNKHMGGQLSAEVHLAKDWPGNASVLEDADAIVIYCDGGKRHMANEHLEGLDVTLKKGVGLACLHYAVETTKGESGEKFLEWMGGYFEPHWSVNPHWDAEFKMLPTHPITRGVEPFTIRDEWYFHMRFVPGMEGVTPILSAHPPKETMNRKDGAHSGNPHVRKAIENGEIQHVAWAYERPGGGRGFGFTGGHFHKNWGHDDFRKLVLNAITWIAKAEVPENGVPS
ncbi:MAG: DUF1080 domain-containing protein, partial [Akkermansiaceae bacterium]|nr:DUF1080 domain-containing protein [Akkermansiaceae bacterium]